MDRPEKVSVIIPHYGEPDPTCDLITILCGQADEIIIADDASPEEFPEIEGVRVVRRPDNGGFGAACNSGAQAASGDYLLFLNSDAVVSDTFVSDLVGAAKPWQPCVAGPRLDEGARGINPSARHFPVMTHRVVEWLVPLAHFHDRRWMSRAFGHDVNAMDATTPVPTDWVVGAAMLIPRRAFEAVGGFDEFFYMNSEEVDLQRRLNTQGVRAVFVPSVVVQHQSGGSSDPAKRLGWVVDSWRRYERKWGHERALQVALSAATGVNFVWNTGRRLLKRPVRPLAEAAVQWGAVWGKTAAPARRVRR